MSNVAITPDFGHCPPRRLLISARSSLTWSQLFLHLFIVLLSTIKVFLGVQTEPGYNTLAMRHQWQTLLVHEDTRQLMSFSNNDNIWPLPSQDLAINVMRLFTSTYFSSNTSCINMQSTNVDPDGKDRPVIMSVYGADNHCKKHYKITLSQLGILGINSEVLLRRCIVSSTAVQLMANFTVYHSGAYRICREWTIRLILSFQGDGTGHMYIRPSSSPCPSSFYRAPQADGWLLAADSLLIMLPVASIMLLAGSIGGSWVHNAISLWFMLGDLASIFSSIMNMIFHNTPRALIALSALTSWLRLVQYAQLIAGPDATVLARILFSSLPEISKIIIGASPIMFGLTITGVSLFAYRSSRFSSFGVAFQTLFAMVNGDYVQEAFQDTEGDLWLIGLIYIVSAVSVITWILLNMILARIQSGFFDEVLSQDFLSCRSRFHLQHLRSSPHTTTFFDPYHLCSDRSKNSSVPTAKLECILTRFRQTLITMTSEWMHAHGSAIDNMLNHRSPCADSRCIVCQELTRFQLERVRFTVLLKQLIHHASTGGE
uniref:Ion transport domain-containing protein n=1 Tax=Spongospora subterranea TaxID=70186 RepID=A0A0H5RPU0_9EUKA|eukprot:CRZ10744.1 hypothetical protein [Spongospora subterranea]